MAPLRTCRCDSGSESSASDGRVTDGLSAWPPARSNTAFRPRSTSPHPSVLSIGRELAGVAGDALAMELRASRLFADDGAIDVFAATLRWSLKF